MSKETIFREVEVDTDQMITLGAPVPTDVQGMMVPAGQNQMQMKPGTFGHAESITVSLNATTQYVQSINFNYAPGTSYQELVDTYTGGMGPPASSSSSSTVWQDSQTTFELVSQGGRVSSVLTDRSTSASAA